MHKTEGETFKGVGEGGGSLICDLLAKMDGGDPRRGVFQ